MRFRPWHLAAGTVVIVVAIAVLATGGPQPGSVRKEGDLMTMIVSTAAPTDAVTVAVALREGNDAEHESSHIFEALSLPGIATLTLDVRNLSLTVAYDAGTISEQAIRARLIEAGYAERSIEDAVPTQATADGTGRTIHLVPGETLEPSFIRTPAGVPLTITFSAGSGHLASVAVPALGITQDLTEEGAAITIAEPVAGTYELVCAEGYADATLVVE